MFERFTGANKLWMFQSIHLRPLSKGETESASLSLRSASTGSFCRPRTFLRVRLAETREQGAYKPAARFPGRATLHARLFPHNEI